MGKVRVLRKKEKVNEQTTVIGFKNQPTMGVELNCEYIWDTILNKVHTYIKESFDKEKIILIDKEKINKIISQAIADELLYIAGTLFLENLSAQQIVEEIKKDEDELEDIILESILDDVVKQILPLYYKVNLTKEE